MNVVSQHSILNTIDEIAAGQIPDEFNLLTDLGIAIAKTSHYGVQALAVIVAKARQEHFAGNVREWSEWAVESFEVTANYLHHLRRIGDMFLLLLQNRSNCSVQHYRKLFELDYDRLYAISAIATVEPDRLLPFLSHFDVREMSREDTRDAVREWLGEPVTVKKEQPKLPGFDDAVNAVIVLDENTLRSAVSNAGSAEKTLLAGMGLLGAAMEYHKTCKTPDVKLLQEAKAALLDEIETIEDAIARAVAQ